MQERKPEPKQFSKIHNLNKTIVAQIMVMVLFPIYA